MKNNLLLQTDVYKFDHAAQYAKGTTKVYSYFCPRKASKEYGDQVIFFGLQYYLDKYLTKPVTKADVDEFKEISSSILGPDAINYSRYYALADLGYLPIKIKAIPEGERVGVRNALFTIQNTHPDFFWLVNYIETLLLKVWYPTTVATISNSYRRLCDKYADITCDNKGHLPFQIHDFGYRAVSSEESAGIGGAAHLLNFMGTDTTAGVKFLKDHYHGQYPIGLSVPASEHSVMCSFSKENDDLDAIRNMLTTYPKGIVSIVSDSYDFWKAVGYFTNELKDLVLSREGKTVVRPDSGDPVTLLCGYAIYDTDISPTFNQHDYRWEGGPFQLYEIADEGYTHLRYKDKLFKIETAWCYDYEEHYLKPVDIPVVEQKGLIEVLWESFGGTVNSKGYKVLNDKIGAIYGDAIYFERAEEIFKRLAQKGFASSNVVFGVGGILLQCSTRDTFGFSLKAAYTEVNGEPRAVMKDPKTDSSKRSHKGLLSVVRNGWGIYQTLEDVTSDEENIGELQTVYANGKVLRKFTLEELRGKLMV